MDSVRVLRGVINGPRALEVIDPACTRNTGMKVFVAGATGVIGRRLVPLLIRDGHQVTAITRSKERVSVLRTEGANSVPCDVFDSEALNKAVQTAKPDVVIHQLTSIPRRLDARRIEEELAQTNLLRPNRNGSLVLRINGVITA